MIMMIGKPPKIVFMKHWVALIILETQRYQLPNLPSGVGMATQTVSATELSEKRQTVVSPWRSATGTLFFLDWF
jgi:hypothetical protein